MSEGERLLQDHKKHVSVHNALRRRIEQYCAERDRPDAVIENLALRHTPLGEAAGERAQGSPVEHIVDSYPRIHDQQRQEVQVKLNQLEEKLQVFQDMLNLYDAVLAGLEQAEIWLIREYFDKGRTLDDLAAERDCVKSTMLSKKRKIIRKVDILLAELCPGRGAEDFYEEAL